VSNLTFDQLRSWVAVGLASAQRGGDKPDEIWVVCTLRPHPDGTLTGESIRASTNSACAAKRTVKFTRTGDADPNKVADPAVLPTRLTTPPTRSAAATARRQPSRTAPSFRQELMSADDKWTRSERGTTMCSAGGTAQITTNAEYPMPAQMDDPIALLTGSGIETVAAGGACTGGFDFQDKFERTGD
jgi:serine/threonine-protein kinase